MTRALGQHLIADVAGAHGLDDAEMIAETLRLAALAAHLTLLSIHVHPFGEGQGVTGVALLAESHISIHTWPEHALHALDVFACGPNADPKAALAEVLARHGGTVIREHAVARLIDGPEPPR